jgi:hypothetical protein
LEININVEEGSYRRVEGSKIGGKKHSEGKNDRK